MKYLLFLFIVSLNSCITKADKNIIKSEKWIGFKDSNNQCSGKIRIIDTATIVYENAKGNEIDRIRFVERKGIVYMLSSLALYSPSLKKEIEYVDIFFTINGVRQMHTLIKKRNGFYIYSIGNVVDDSTFIGKDVDFNLFNKKYNSPENYIDLKQKEKFPLLTSNDFQRFYYDSCKFRWADFYVHNNSDTSRQASYNEIDDEVYGLLLFDIRKMRTDFSNYDNY